MVTFIQQLQQFLLLFQRLKNNLHVVAQLLQQFKWKQEQNTQDMQQRLNMENMNNNNCKMNTVGGLVRTLQARQSQQQQQEQNNLQQSIQSQQNTQTISMPTQNIISIQPPNTSNNTGLLPALENENTQQINTTHGQLTGTNNNKASDDVI